MSQIEQPGISLEDSIDISPDVVFRNLEGEAVLLNLQSGVYFGLNATGTKIWNILSENKSLQEAYSSLLEEFAVEPEIAKSDLLALAVQLREKGLITVSAVR